MKKILGIIFLCLILNACTTARQEISSGYIKLGMSKHKLKSALGMTSLSEDAFLGGCYRRYLSDLSLEVLSSSSRSVYFIFQNVNKPSVKCSRSLVGDGRLASIQYTLQGVETYINSKKPKTIVKKQPKKTEPKKTEPKKTEPKKTESKKTEPGKLYAVASGTGFFINASGNIISNNHVIDSCGTVKVHYNGVSKPVTILATDYMNDLSLMKSDIKPDDYFSVSSNDAILLDEIYVAGYPFGKAISSSVKVTKGVVSALTGLGNNYSNIQIDAALQPGNSGGPIINNKGNVVGVAVAKLDYKAIIEDFNAIPEGTNFGIKSSTVQQFIKANNISSVTGAYRKMTTQDIGKKIEKATVYLDCWMTAQQINQYKTKKTFYKNIE